MIGQSRPSAIESGEKRQASFLPAITSSSASETNAAASEHASVMTDRVGNESPLTCSSTASNGNEGWYDVGIINGTSCFVSHFLAPPQDVQTFEVCFKSQQ